MSHRPVNGHQSHNVPVSLQAIVWRTLPPDKNSMQKKRWAQGGLDAGISKHSPINSSIVESVELVLTTDK